MKKAAAMAASIRAVLELLLITFCMVSVVT
jgi:hypothetical protein